MLMFRESWTIILGIHLRLAVRLTWWKGVIHLGIIRTRVLLKRSHAKHEQLSAVPATVSRHHESHKSSPCSRYFTMNCIRGCEPHRARHQQTAPHETWSRSNCICIPWRVLRLGSPRFAETDLRFCPWSVLRKQTSPSWTYQIVQHHQGVVQRTMADRHEDYILERKYGKKL
jgi:hypothetical protein